jgi:hypothetical protein
LLAGSSTIGWPLWAGMLLFFGGGTDFRSGHHELQLVRRNDGLFREEGVTARAFCVLRFTNLYGTSPIFIALQRAAR